MNIKVYVEAEVRFTEDIQKVKNAINNVFSGAISTIYQDNGKRFIKGEGDRKSLYKFQVLLKKDQIRVAARKHLISRLVGNRIIFYLNKQVAFVEHISFCESEQESPLGPIKFEIHTTDPLKVVDWLTYTNS